MVEDGDVDPTGDRTWRGDAYEALNADLARERFARRAIDQALLDAIAERDRLRGMWEEQRAIVKRCHESTLGQLTAERDRLRAVVDAVRHFIALQVTDDHPPEDDTAAWEQMIASLEQLDVSPTGEDT